MTGSRETEGAPLSTKVTIITRTRDREVLLGRAVASVAAQTHSDYEHVIVNDGGSVEAVERVLASQSEEVRSRVTVVTNGSSHGREAAVEDGLAASTCPLFAIHDDDDSWEPDFLERCVEHLDAHPEHAAVATRCDVVYEHLEEAGVVEDRREVLASDLDGWSLVDTLVVNFVPPISQVVRRSVADSIGHWDGSLQTQADWEFNLRLLREHCVGFLPETVLAHWHQRPSQGNALGNSVVDDAARHRADNMAIRDRYARESSDQALGPMLVTAAYYKRLSDSLRTLEVRSAEHTVSLDVLHRVGTDRTEHLTAVGDAVARVAELEAQHSSRIQHLEAQIEEQRRLLEEQRHLLETQARALEAIAARPASAAGRAAADARRAMRAVRRRMR